MKTLENKVALVTGAGSGIGRAIAGSLAQAGCKLVLVDIDSFSLEDVSDELNTHTLVLPVVGDVTEQSAVERFCEMAVITFLRSMRIPPNQSFRPM